MCPFTASAGIPAGFGRRGRPGVVAWRRPGPRSITNQVGNGEINYRSWDGAINGFELILGVRALSIRQSLGVTTDQLALTDAPDLATPPPIP